MVPVPVLSPAQAAAWDAAAEAAGIAPAVLMETAGRAVADLLLDRFAAAARAGVLVACGPGNNGGDGWVVARRLHRLGVPVWACPLAGAATPLAGTMARLARADGVRVVAPEGPWPAVGCVVDAILGTGARGAPRDAARTLADRLADLRVPTVAVDGPTGLDLLDGVSHGAHPADLSVTFGGYRRGLLLARDEAGDCVVVDLGFPAADPSWPVLHTLDAALAALPPLPARAHKGTRGRVAVVGGDVGLTGAARLTARAAFGAGAGLVHILAPAPAVEILSTAEPDLQTSVLPFDAPPAGDAAALIGQADVVVVGPGLNRHPSRAGLVSQVLAMARAAVVDADALTVLQGQVGILTSAARERPVVLTPHAGEFRTLFPELAAGAATDPWAAAAEAASRTGATVLLKGVPTVVAGPGALAPVTVAAGNPGLATGGSGDLLSGLIAVFLAQGLPAVDAAALGAQALGQAADLAARGRSARSLRPMDVIEALPGLWRSWELARSLGPAWRPPVLHELPRPLRA